MRKIVKTVLTALGMTAVLMLGGCAKPVEEGAELLKEKKFAEAQEKFQTAVDKEKELGEAYRGLGICYWEQKEYEQAEKSFGLALDNGAEETATIYNLLGLCALETDKPEKAVFYFEEGQKFPDAGQELLKEMAFNLVAAYEQVGDWALAKEKLKTYVELYPEDARAVKELEFLNTQVPEKEDGE